MVTNRKRVQVIVSTAVLFILAIAATSCNGFFVDPILQTITVTPATPGILVNGTQQMTATGSYDDGSQKNLTGTSSWTSSDLTVATVSPSGGLVTGIAAGTATIQATNGIVSGSTTVTVSLTGVTAITAAPSSQSAVTGTPFCLTATAQPSGTDISATATWTFTDPTNQTETGVTKTTSTTCTGQAFVIGTLTPTPAPTMLGAVASAPGAGGTTVNSNKATINVTQ